MENRAEFNITSVGDNASTVTNNSHLECNFKDDYKFTAYSVVYCLVFTVGLVTNVTALYIFCRLAKKKRMSTVFLMNLAIADLIFILTLPFRIFSYMTKTDWSFVNTACRISTYIFYVSMYCSIFFLTSLSICRYLVMARCVKFQNNLSYKWLLALCLAVWVLITVAIISYVSVITGFQIEVRRCFEPLTPSSWELLYRLNLYALVIGFVIPFSILLGFMPMLKSLLRVCVSHVPKTSSTGPSACSTNARNELPIIGSEIVPSSTLANN
ncbi:lysophosphatidic acid receptor 6-like [Amia ocellicauda]|uniref:lysophosphatidic acid receptor 6-like n=1 Tax=Amia ocellicauda TaxID=2972642 RepID=UPI003464C71C